MTRDTPTLPPSEADAQADAFAARIAEVERRARRRNSSGLIRALAEARAEKETPCERRN